MPCNNCRAIKEQNQRLLKQLGQLSQANAELACLLTAAGEIPEPTECLCGKHNGHVQEGS